MTPAPTHHLPLPPPAPRCRSTVWRRRARRWRPPCGRRRARRRHTVDRQRGAGGGRDRKSTRLNSSHSQISYAVFCLKKKTKLVAEIALGARSWGLALSRDGRRLFSANGPSNEVSIDGTSSLSVIKKGPVGREPRGGT